MVEIINSLGDLCRLCAGKIDVLMGINIFESDHRQIFKKICVCLPIQISVDDNFPKMVCVECACKLDLLFDFRERSILTAHLFSDMMTVGQNNEITVDQSISIESQTETPETDFNSDFMSCKLDSVKFNSELGTKVCSSENQPVLENQAISLQSSNNIRKSTKKADALLRNDNIHNLDANIKEQSKSTNILENKSLSSNIFLPSEEPNLNDGAANKTISGAELEVTSVVATNEASQELSTLKTLDWLFCNICSKSFTDKEEFDLHNHENVSNNKAENERSGERNLNMETLPNKKKKTKQKKSVKMKSGNKKIESKVCLECGKEYQTNYKLQEHMRKHTGEKPYLCSYGECRKAFRSKIGLAQHEANHSGQFEFSCSTCGKGFQCKSYLVVHQRVHSDLKPYVCKQCSHKFKTKQSLLDHMNRHLGVKPFLCDICGRGFITKGLCKSHQKVHSGTDNRQYPCNVCRKLFVSKSYLNTHFRIHTGEKPFMCEVCGKGFLTKVDLRIHSTMHTGEKSFVCEMCGKAFARRDALRCHRRSHTGERPYKCEFCGQSFTQFSPMAIHKRLHTGERPYECDVCNKTFVSRSTMLTHRKKHHATNNESKLQFVAVEVQPNESNGHIEQPGQHLVVIENSSQLLLALSKRHPVNEPSEILMLHKMKNENLGVPVE